MCNSYIAHARLGPLAFVVPEAASLHVNHHFGHHFDADGLFTKLGLGIPLMHSGRQRAPLLQLWLDLDFLASLWALDHHVVLHAEACVCTYSSSCSFL